MNFSKLILGILKLCVAFTIIIFLPIIIIIAISLPVVGVVIFLLGQILFSFDGNRLYMIGDCVSFLVNLDNPLDNHFDNLVAVQFKQFVMKSIKVVICFILLILINYFL